VEHRRLSRRDGVGGGRGTEPAAAALLDFRRELLGTRLLNG
jgi:hypothetical protein